MRTLILTAIAVALTIGVPQAACADHLILMPEARSADTGFPSPGVDLDLRFGNDGFRLGARVFRERGVSGAWLNGRLRPDGLSLDGRVQDGGRAYNFKLDADLPGALARVAPWWLSR